MASILKSIRVVFIAIAIAASMVTALWSEVDTAWAEPETDYLAGSIQACSAGSLADISWDRLWGQKALDTMEAITRAGEYKTGGVVVLVTVEGFWDALTASGLAGLSDAPVIMTDGKTLSAQTRNLLGMLKPQTIVVCGGTAAVSDSVVSAASAASGGAVVKRCWGKRPLIRQ